MRSAWRRPASRMTYDGVAQEFFGLGAMVDEAVELATRELRSAFGAVETGAASN